MANKGTFSQKGVTLVELLVAFAVSVALLSVMVGLVSQQSRSLYRFQGQVEILELIEEIKSNIANDDICTEALKGQSTSGPFPLVIPKITSNDGVVFQPGQTYGDGTVIEQIRANNYVLHEEYPEFYFGSIMWEIDLRAKNESQTWSYRSWIKSDKATNAIMACSLNLSPWHDSRDNIGYDMLAGAGIGAETTSGTPLTTGGLPVLFHQADTTAPGFGIHRLDSTALGVGGIALYHNNGPGLMSFAQRTSSQTGMTIDPKGRIAIQPNLAYDVIDPATDPHFESAFLIRGNIASYPDGRLLHMTQGYFEHFFLQFDGDDLRFEDNGANIMIHNPLHVGSYGKAPAGYRLFVDGVAGGDFAWNVVSDRRLKENIFSLTKTKYAEQIIDQLRPVSFRWKKDKDPNKVKEVGFIAQDVEKILPEIVRDTDQFKTLSTSKVLPFLVEAFKALDSRREAERTKFLQFRDSVCNETSGKAAICKAKLPLDFTDGGGH